MPPIAVHEVTTFYNMFNQAPVGRVKLNVCTNLPCQLRGGQHALEHLCGSLGIAEGGTTADGAFTVQKSECLGACADAPVLLVNDRQMVSFMSDATARRAGLVLACADGGEPGMNATFDLARFQATGQETCFHGRHIEPQIYAGLDGTNWRLKDYEARGGYKAPAQDPGARRGRRHDAGAGDRRGQVVGPARPRRRGLSDRAEVELHAAPVPGRQVPGLQLRRRRARHLQGPRPADVQPAHGHRGDGHRRLRDGRERRLQLHPRRDLRGLRALRGSARGSARRRLPGPEAARLRLRLPAPRQPRLRRLHLRRGNGAARVARGQEGPAALQAAVPGELRPLRQADDGQQHRDLRRGAVDHPQRRPGLPRGRQAEQRRHQDLLRGRRRAEARQLRGAARHALHQAARACRRRAAKGAR